MNAQELATLQAELYDLLVSDLEKALAHLRAAVPIGSTAFRETLQLQGRLNVLERDQRKGTVDYKDYQLAINCLRDDLLSLIENLSLADLERQPAEAVLERGRTGALLYQIPERMQLQQAINCRVRLAYSEAVARMNLPEGPVPEVRSLVVAEVMQVRLIDANAQPSFSIKPFSREEQSLAEGVFAEWVFQLIPLRAGHCSLLLQVAVVELILGKERVREIVFEEEIEVIAETVAATEPPTKKVELSLLDATVDGPATAGKSSDRDLGAGSPFALEREKWQRSAVDKHQIDDWLPDTGPTSGAVPPGAAEEPAGQAPAVNTPPPPAAAPPMPQPSRPAQPAAGSVGSPPPPNPEPMQAAPAKARRIRLGPILIGMASVLLILLIALPLLFMPATTPTDPGIRDPTDRESNDKAFNPGGQSGYEEMQRGILGAWAVEAIHVNDEPAMDLMPPLTYHFGSDGQLTITNGQGQTIVYQYTLAHDRLSLLGPDGSQALGYIRELEGDKLSLRLDYTDALGTRLMDIDLRRE